MSNTSKHLYELIKHTLVKNGYDVNPYREKNTSLHFIVFIENESGLISLSEKNGEPDYDLSEIQSPILKNHIQTLIDPHFKSMGKLLSFDPSLHEKKKAKISPTPTKEPSNLLGTVSLGHDNYFGPLIVSGVYVSEKTRLILNELNLQDYHSWTNEKYHYIAKLISETCEHSSIIMANHSYNTVFERIQNPQQMISWCHLRVIENLRRQIKLTYIVSHSFGNKSLIDSNLFAKGYDMMLYEKENAHDMIPIQAAYILGKSALIKRFKEMKKVFKVSFPEGDNENVRQIARALIKNHQRDMLMNVAKLHFSITDDLGPIEK